MSPEDVAAGFANGDLEMDCLEIVARQNASFDPIVYRGPGSISLGEDGSIYCKIYSLDTPYDLIEDLKRYDKAVPGTLYAEDDYYSITATAMNGNTWKAERTLVSTNRTVLAPTKPTVTARLSEIVHRGSRGPRGRTGQGIELVIVDQDEAEWAALFGEWTSEVPTPGCRFAVSAPGGGHVRVEASTDAMFPDGFQMSLIEALSFVTGETLRVRTSRTKAGDEAETRLLAAGPSPKPRQRFRPLDLRRHENAEPARDVLMRYCEFAQTRDMAGFWHPCSAHLAHARASSDSSLDAWAVAACVALEGIASLLECEISSADKLVIKRVQSVVARWLRCLKIRKPLHDRVLGVLSQLSNVRVVDRLAPLVEAGRVDRDYLDAWKAARNRAVHTVRMNPQAISDPGLQESLSRLLQVITLINQVVFALIGYGGPYVDYGKPGFPVRGGSPAAAPDREGP